MGIAKKFFIEKKKQERSPGLKFIRPREPKLDEE